MTARPTRAPDPEERRKLFRRMEWVFVWAPPLLIILIAGSAGALVAWLVPIEGFGFWARWLFVFLVVIGAPLLVYVVRERLRR